MKNEIGFSDQSKKPKIFYVNKPIFELNILSR